MKIPLDISAWPIDISRSTKGTRDKVVLLDPNSGESYFLKFPMVRPNRDYSAETWSEIIVYEVGIALGFNVLKYSFAMYNGRAGCISKNMVGGDCESLVEGESILTGCNPSYDPSDKRFYKDYTFEFVMKALNGANYDEECKKGFVKMLILDAIFGNSDRHQSNWGFIHTSERSESETSTFDSLQTYKYTTKKRFSPIYDSGACLGREFSEEEIVRRLENKDAFAKYLRKGVAELRITAAQNKKVQHTQLLRGIMELSTTWSNYIKQEIVQSLNAYGDGSEVKELIQTIDDFLPPDIKEKHGLSPMRKVFICKTIDARIQNLKELLK